MNYHSMHCQICGGGIEFPSDGIGETVPCPHCAASVVLVPDVAGVQTTNRMRIGLCPKCGSEVLERSEGFYCRDPVCPFKIRRTIMGQVLDSSQASKLVATGRTDLLDGFVSKNGRKFAARLTIDEGKLTFEFPTHEVGETATRPPCTAPITLTPDTMDTASTEKEYEASRLGEQSGKPLTSQEKEARLANSVQTALRNYYRKQPIQPQAENPAPPIPENPPALPAQRIEPAESNLSNAVDIPSGDYRPFDDPLCIGALIGFAMSWPVLAMNTVGMVVTVAWLLWLQQWSALIVGLVVFFCAMFIASILLMPGVLFCLPLQWLENNKIIRLPFVVLLALWMPSVMAAWASLCFCLLPGLGDSSAQIPLLLLSYGLAVCPWHRLMVKSNYNHNSDGGAALFQHGVFAFGCLAAVAAMCFGASLRTGIATVSAFSVSTGLYALLIGVIRYLQRDKEPSF